MGEQRVERIRALAGGGLSAWREAQTTGGLREHGPRRAAVVAGLARRWRLELDEQVEAVVVRHAPGGRRLRLLLGTALDRSRATAGVRALLADEGVDLALDGLLAGHVAEDLAALGVPSPARSAADLLGELAAVTAAEDAAGRVLRSERRALLAAPAPRRRLRLAWA